MHLNCLLLQIFTLYNMKICLPQFFFFFLIFIIGACGGTLACSTCHCIFKQKDFERLGLQKISEEELDMLDLAYGLTDTYDIQSF